MCTEAIRFSAGEAVWVCGLTLSRNCPFACKRDHESVSRAAQPHLQRGLRQIESADSWNRKGHGGPEVPFAQAKKLPLTAGFTPTPAFMISASVHQP